MGRFGHREDRTSERSIFWFPPPKQVLFPFPFAVPLKFPLTTYIFTAAEAGIVVAIDIVAAAAAAYTASFFMYYLLM